MAAKNLFDYDLEYFHYGELCEVEEVDQSISQQKQPNHAYDELQLPLQKDLNGISKVKVVISNKKGPLGVATYTKNVSFFPFIFNELQRRKLKNAITDLGLTQENAADLMGISSRSLVGYLADAVPKGQNLEQVKLFLKLYDLLKSNIDLSYALRRVLNTEHDAFARKTAVSFSKEEGKSGLLMVIGTFRRIYE